MSLRNYVMYNVKYVLGGFELACIIYEIGSVFSSVDS